MIGQKLKGIRHLTRMAESFGEIQFFFSTNGLDIQMGAIKFIPNSVLPNRYFRSDGKKDWCIFFNHAFRNASINLDDFNGTSLNDDIRKLGNMYGNTCVIPIPFKGKECGFHIENIIIVPQDFDNQYNAFIEANKKMVEPLVRSFYGGKDSPFAKYIFAITEGSKNFFQWATMAIFKYQQSTITISQIMRWNDVYGKMANKLPKGSITSHNGGREGLCYLYNEMCKLRRDKRANDVINTFNTTQKKALKNYELKERDYETLSRFSKLSFRKRDNFIKKMSSIEDVDEILRQMAFLADVHFVWKKESFMDYLKNNENLSYQLIFDKDNIVLLKVNDYETVKRLTKSTNWCISKDRKYWVDYVEGRHDVDQYVIFNFSCKEDDALSIVGFSLHKTKGITHSHDFNNRDMMNGSRNNRNAEMRSFINGEIVTNSIFSVLENSGIDLSILVPSEKMKYEWSRDGVIGMIRECVGDYDYYIISDSDNKLVIITENNDIKYFFGDKFIDNIRMADSQNTIIFVDFNKTEQDPSRILFGVITHDYKRNESNVNRLYNIGCNAVQKSFDKLIDEWGLPYDIICRNDDILERFYNAYGRYELSTCKDLIKTDIVKDDIKSHERHNIINEIFNNSIYDIRSADYVDMFIENGISIVNDVSSRRLFTSLIDNAYQLYSMSSMVSRNPMPTDEELANPYNGGENVHRNLYVGYLSIFKKIIDAQGDTQSYNTIIGHIIGRGRQNSCYDIFMKLVLGKLGPSDGDLIESISKYAIAGRRVELSQMLLDKGMVSEKVAGQLKYLITEAENNTKRTINKIKQSYSASDFITVAQNTPFTNITYADEHADAAVRVVRRRQ